MMLTAIFAVGGLYVLAIYVLLHEYNARTELDLGALADQFYGPSVTIVSIIRLVSQFVSIFNIFGVENEVLWMNIEANASIICGQYTTALTYSYLHQRQAG